MLGVCAGVRVCLCSPLCAARGAARVRRVVVFWCYQCSYCSVAIVRVVIGLFCRLDVRCFPPSADKVNMDEVKRTTRAQAKAAASIAAAAAAAGGSRDRHAIGIFCPRFLQ